MRKAMACGMILLFILQNLNAQQAIGIGTTSPNATAILDINSTSKGALLPRMTTSQRLGISTPANGLMVYDLDKEELYHYDGTAWRAILNGTYWSRPAANRSRISNFSDSVGIGNNGPTARLQVNGDVRIIDGTEGDGKVLTSDANGRASWQSTAFGTNDRVMMKFSGFDEDSSVTFPQIVYTNGSGITYSTFFKRFTINKNGLYRFNGAIARVAPVLAYPSNRVVGFIQFDDNLLYLGSVNIVESPSEPGIVVGKMPFNFSIDLYLEAGATVYIKVTGYPTFSTGSAASRNSYVSAYLINE